MRYIKLIIILLIISVFSCKEKTAVNTDEVMTDSIPPAKGRIISSIGEPLIPRAREEINEWREYEEVDSYLRQYYSITVMDALNNAQELSELVTFMKDSIRVEILDQPNVVARMNVLQNQSLRLADMAKIPSIKDEEVKEEVTRILEVFHALNSKINTIYKAIEIQESLDVDTEIPLKLDEEKTIEQGKPRNRTSAKRIES